MLGRIKKNDTVLVLSGKDRGKKGLVLKVDSKQDLVTVKDINVVVRHEKSKRAGQPGAIVREEKALVASKLMPVCMACKKACRVRFVADSDMNKSRACVRCKESF